MDPEDAYRLISPRYRAICSARLPREDAARWLADPNAVGGRRGEIACGEASGGFRVFVKRHRRPIRKVLADGAVRRKTPARRAFETGLFLERNGVAAARPLAVIERRLPGESFLVLEFVEGLNLRQYILQKLPEAASEMERDDIKARVWGAVGRLVARLHSAKVRQRDLKALNIMIEPSDGGPRARLVDLEGMQRLRRLPSRRQRARDLARLAVSLRTPDMRAASVGPADCEETVRLYLESCRAAFPEERDLHWWADAILSWAEAKEARNYRLGRPIY